MYILHESGLAFRRRADDKNVLCQIRTVCRNNVIPILQRILANLGAADINLLRHEHTRITNILINLLLIECFGYIILVVSDAVTHLFQCLGNKRIHLFIDSVVPNFPIVVTHRLVNTEFGIIHLEDNNLLITLEKFLDSLIALVKTHVYLLCTRLILITAHYDETDIILLFRFHYAVKMTAVHGGITPECNSDVH